MTPIVPRRVVFSQNARWALAIAVALVGTAAATGTAYDTIDDVLMNGFAAGRLITSAPNAHLIFTNVLVGLPLKLAYQAWDGLPWYGLYLLLTLAAATAAFLWAFAGALHSWPGRILVLGFLLGTVSVTFSRLQFTRVAFLAVEAGWMVVAASLVRTESRQWTAGLGGVLVLLGTCIRSEIGLLATVLCVPLLLATLGAALWQQSSRDRIRTLSVPATVIVLCALAVAIDAAYYRMDHSWRTFLEYHDARTKLMGTTRGEATQIPADTLAHVAWSPNDVSLMYSYFGLHDKVFSLEHQQYVAEHSSGWRWSLRDDALKTLAPLRTSRFVPLFLFVALAALVLSDGLVDGATIVGSMALLAAVIGLLAADWKLPERFYEPALGVPAATALALLGGRTETERGRLLVRGIFGGGGRTWMATVLGFAALGVAVVQLADARMLVQENHEDHRNIVSAIAELHPRPEQLYVAWGGDFPYNTLVNPLDGFSGADNLQILPLGWANNAPLQRQRLAQYHIADVYQALWQNPNVFLIASADRCLRLASFVANHYGQLVSCVPRNESLSIYKVIPTFAQGPSINVRWRKVLADVDRQNLEARYGLRRPRPLEDATWRYELADTSSALLAALVHDPMVDDTAGLDRRTGALTHPQPDW